MSVTAARCIAADWVLAVPASCVINSPVCCIEVAPGFAHCAFYAFLGLLTGPACGLEMVVGELIELRLWLLLSAFFAYPSHCLGLALLASSLVVLALVLSVLGELPRFIAGAAFHSGFVQALLAILVEGGPRFF